MIDTKNEMNVVFRTQNYELGHRNRARLEKEAGKLFDITRDFPVADLHVDIHEYPKNKGFHVKTSLRLPNDSLFTGDRHKEMHTAYLRCIRKLMLKVKAYKAKLAGEAHYAKPNYETAAVQAEVPNEDLADQAYASGDYHAFRGAMTGYESGIRDVIADFCKTDEYQAMMIGHGFNANDLMEELFLNAFEHYEDRGRVKMTNWLADLVEESFGKLVAHPQFELQKIEAMTY